jgi:hypothetical protein
VFAHRGRTGPFAACSRSRGPTDTTSARTAWAARTQWDLRLLEREDLLDWRPWVGTSVSEDVVVGLLTFAARLRIRGYVEPGEVFALGWRELPLPPEQILARGYSVVHSVRDQLYGDERELRAYFRAHRTAQC